MSLKSSQDIKKNLTVNYCMLIYLTIIYYDLYREHLMKNRKVLIIDDDYLNVAIVSDFLVSSGYNVITAYNGDEGFKSARDLSPDVILLDVIMSGMDGFDTCRMLKKSTVTRHIPVVMLTALTDKDSRHKGLDAGAIDFLNKPVDMIELTIRLKNVIQLKEYHDHLRNYNEQLEKIVEQRTMELRDSFIDTLYRLTMMAEQKDKGTASHIRRVSHYASFLAKLLGLSSSEADVMFHASPMHDIGKIGIPDAILQNPGKLTAEEYYIMQQHTTMGGSVLCGSNSDYLKSAKRFALYHHENWDGTGYPYGLKGEEIPLEGRLMLIIDRYDALRSIRPYKTSIDHNSALKVLLEGGERSSPSHFDPVVLDAFKKHHYKFAEIFEEHRETGAYKEESL